MDNRIPISTLLKSVYNVDWSKLYILECGACTEGTETRELTECSNKWFIEPNPDDFNALKETQDNAYNFAISDFVGEIEFTTTSHSGNSSIKHSKKHLEELKQYKTKYATIKVKAITYEYLIDNIIKSPVDILVLDIEGHESKVLRNLKTMKSDKLPSIFVIECGYDWNERKVLLNELGYEIDFYFYNNCFLSRKDFGYERNLENIKKYNNMYPVWEYYGTTVYINDAKIK